MNTCTHCGSWIDDERQLGDVIPCLANFQDKFSQYQSIMLRVMGLKLGRIISEREFFHHLYGDRIDRGPLYGSEIIKVQISYTRKKLRECGVPLEIRTPHGQGYALFNLGGK